MYGMKVHFLGLCRALVIIDPSLFENLNKERLAQTLSGLLVEQGIQFFLGLQKGCEVGFLQ